MGFRIETDDLVVGSTLAAMVGILERAGGHLHPSARLAEEQGELRLLADPGADGVLVRLPRSMLVPIDAADWRWEGGRLALQHSPRGLTAEQGDLLHLFTELYNATGKPAWFASTHPRGAQLPATVAAAVTAVRPGWAPDPSPTGFLRTRTLGTAPAGDPGGPRSRGLMPVVDLINNHCDSPGYDVDDMRLEVRASQPTGTGECFVRYHPVPDALDLVLNYGFVETSAGTAFSAPVVVEVGGLSVEVMPSRPPLREGATLPTVVRTADGLRLSHLLFDARRPARTRAAIGLAVQGAAQRHDRDAVALGGQAFDALVAANLDLLAALADRATAVDSPACRVIAGAARAQARTIAAVA